jgi:hypothetical protein
MLRRRIHEDWETIRRRMLRETEEYLKDALEHPDLAVHIPAHPVGRGSFPRAFCIAFWQRVLFGAE